MANKLLKKIVISGELTLETGLHIGGTNSSMSIGGIDKAVIRNPLNNQPYIPGSSLKGKMRSLLEISTGKIGGPAGGVVKHGPLGDTSSNNNPLPADLFGNAANNDKQKPSRLIVRDLSLINHKELLEKTEIPYTEGKTEVVIDRITSAAMPRQNERVPAGAKFKLNMVVNIWEQDANERQLLETLFASLQLLSDDYLGGHGSRGYGQVSINITSMEEKSTDTYYNGTDTVGKSILSQWQTQIDRLKAKAAQA
jgi:CRISPR-associated protein Csm3